MNNYESVKIQNIRAQYAEKTMTKFDELKELDKRVKAPAEIFAYAFGTAGALTLGTGMCLAMKMIGASLAFAMPLGIAVGCLGILMVSVNYSCYQKILNSRKRKYANEIFKLSDELLNK